MSTTRTQHYIEAIEMLLAQWADLMPATADAIECQERSKLPIYRIRLLSEQLLDRQVPPSCVQLHKDLTRLINTHSWHLYRAFQASDDIASNYGEYQEALITAHAEIIRLRARYQPET